MKTIRSHPVRIAALACVAWIAATTSTRAQTTNWIAYNDHRPSTTPAGLGWVTAPNVTGYNMGAAADDGGPLTDFHTGVPLGATVSFTRTGAPDDFGALGPSIRTNTPMAAIFFKICNLQNDGIVGVRATNAVPSNASESYVTITFAGLNPAKRYVFRGAGVRNGGYGTRWSVATIGADGFTDAHINGAGGPGVLTGNNFPASALAPNQAAWNSGANNEGAVIGWNDVAPKSDGTFTITVQQYVGNIPGGTATGSAQYGYSFGALMLAEVEIVAPTITANPVASTTVEQNRPFSLSVEAEGAPLNYQWYKQGVGEITGATFPAYSVAQAQVSDSGQYYAVVYNALARRTSTVAQVTVFADNTAPTVQSIFSYPTVDFFGVAVQDRIVIEFNEAVTESSVNKPISYTVPGGGHPASVIVTNSSTVMLMLSSPLAEDTDYSVTLSGATDLVGNVAGSSSPTFHSWVSGIGNGLLMESYPTEDPALTVESLFTDSDYPNNPDKRNTLRAFDTRLVYPDDSRENYGARIRGVFIPPVSGDYRFFARMPVFGVVNINPNGLDEAGKIEIIRQSTQNAPYNWDRLQSSLVSLRAGRAYYIEGIYKNVTGADYFKVAARLAGTGTPLPVDESDLDAPDTNSLAGAIIAFPLAPKNLGGTLAIVQDVADITIDENNPATFSIQLSNPSGLPLQYQWYRDGSPITGANGPTYTIEPTIAGDNGATFSVQVAKVGNTVTSRAASLTVRPDTHGPLISQIISSYTNLSTVIVRFNERVNESDAGDPFTFDKIGDISVLSSTLDPTDGRTITLVLVEPLVAANTYPLSVQSLRDLVGNVIDPNPTTMNFLAGGFDLPRLTIVQSPEYADISWPAPSTGFVLEETSQLLIPANSTVWTPVADTPTVINGRNTISVFTPGSNKFYRLRLPPAP